MIVSKTKAEIMLGKKLKSLGNGKRSYYVLSESGDKNLGGPYTKEDAKKRIQQVEYFKHNPSMTKREWDDFRASVAGGLPRMSFVGTRRGKPTIVSYSWSTAYGEDPKYWPGRAWKRNTVYDREFDTYEEAADALISLTESSPQSNPAPFFERDHNWKEILISNKENKKSRKQILDHYIKYEKKIWPFLKGQTVMIIQGVGRNKFVRRRKRDSDDRYIKLTKLRGPQDERSFEYWVLRRAIEFHPVLTTKSTPLAWIDLDMHKARDAKSRAKLRRKMKEIVPDLKEILKKVGVTKVHVYDSGTDGGLHLEGDLKSKKNVDSLRVRLTGLVEQKFADDPMITTGVAKSDQIRVDTTTLHKLGSLRAPYSMTTYGGWKREISVPSNR